MLEHPGDIATLSMRQVAANAGVSLPNFSRIAKALGFETYGELREIYSKQVQQNDISEYQSARRKSTTSGQRHRRRAFVGVEFRQSTLGNLTAIL